MNAVKSAAAFLSSCVLELLFQTISLLALVPGFSMGSLARQIRGRINGSDSIESIQPSNPSCRGDLLFFCSSAGEFEQARPIIDRLSGRLDLDPIILFLSRSGLEYIRARGENVRAALAPPDTLWRWRRFDSCHRIRGAIVIRHEWWPSFLHVFGRNRPLLLIDAGRPAGSPESKIRNLGRGYLARHFTKICAVDEISAEFFSKNFHIDPTRILATGDTKHDRVMDRARTTRISDSLRAKVQKFAGGRKILVAGSIYAADIELLTSAWRTNPDLQRSWVVVAVPHNINDKTAINLQAIIDRAGCDFLLLCQMGILAELYSLADVAWVGGACHHKVHNVLEPASHGTRLACGVKFRNSPEATQMVGEGILQAIANPDQLAKWLIAAKTEATGPVQAIASPSRSFVMARTGAAEKICVLLERCLAAPEGP